MDAPNTDNASASATLSQPMAAPAAPAAAPASPAAAPSAPASTWFDANNPDVKSYVENKGWKEPGDVLKSYQNLEKLFGADKAGKTLTIPDWNDPTQVSSLYDKLGRPSDAKDYQLVLGDNPDASFVDWAKSTFHELGLSNSQAKALTEKWAQFAGGTVEQQNSMKQGEFAQQAKALDAEWGAAKDANIRTAQQAAKTFGMDAKAIDALQDAMGYDGVMKFLHGLGSRLGEGEFVDGSSKPGGPLSPGAAQSALKTLMADKEFMSAFLDPRSPKHEWAKAEKAKLSAYQVGMMP